MLGAPTGLNLKHWLSSSQALNLGLAYSLDGGYLALLGDYLWHFPNAFSSLHLGKGGNRLIPYLGVGAALFTNTSGNSNHRYFNNNSNGTSAALGLRIPFGVEFLPRNPPLGVFAELVPGMGIFPETFGFFQGVIGLRYYL
jgi:hypothetical protein